MKQSKKYLQDILEDTRNYEGRYLFNIRNDPGTSVKILYLIQKILAFQIKNGYDKDGKPAKLTFFRILFNKSIRREFASILEDVIGIFKPQR